MDRPTTIGPRLRALREARGLTQDQLARMIGGPAWQGKIGSYERGEIRPGERVALRLAWALGVPLVELVPDFADLAFPEGFVLLLREGPAAKSFAPAGPEHAARLAALGWGKGTVGPGRELAELLALADARGYTLGFGPSWAGEDAT